MSTIDWEQFVLCRYGRFSVIRWPDVAAPACELYCDDMTHPREHARFRVAKFEREEVARTVSRVLSEEVSP